MSLVLAGPAVAAEAEVAEPAASGIGTLVLVVRDISLAFAGWWDALAKPSTEELQAQPETRQRLVDLSARLSQVLAVQRAKVVRAIDDYVETPGGGHWYEVRGALAEVIVELEKLLGDLQGERSDFVLENAYPELIQTITTRAGLARHLLAIEPPETPEELRDLRRVQAEYILLLGNLELAIGELNAFVKAAGAE